ncbi:MAG: FliI/YscN family ATPase [Fimbriimonadaceae bacterium]|nr:FliI/YscN family ATPase [Fimbriimonadaceae bacterium]
MTIKIPVRAPNLSREIERLRSVPVREATGRVVQVVGLVIESNGPASRVGDLCWIEPGIGDRIPAEVVGFRDYRTLLMPLGKMEGVRSGCLVRAAGRQLSVPTGDQLLGRVLNGIGMPMDGGALIDSGLRYPIEGEAPNALERSMIDQPFTTGVRAIDGVLTMGVGQRMGIFAGSGVGKSTLLGMIARHSSADINVICLVGERGREVREFMENDLGEALKKSVVICATSDEPALTRVKAAFASTAIAEYFRDQGLNVMLMMDSVTRFAMAQREVGLAVGEPPSTKGYTPSVFAMLPKLMERTGCGKRGSITAIYTVLVEGDDTNEPIADAARSILDGHIVLSRKLTSRGHYPPIDIMQSLSRVMPMVTSAEHVVSANRLRELVAGYADVEDLVALGAYKEGSKPISDEAISKWDGINRFLRQDKSEGVGISEAISSLQELTDG